METIRPVEPADAQALLDLRLANRDVLPALGARLRATANRWYTLESIAAWIGDDQKRFAIVEDGVVAGMVSLTGIERAASFESAMVGYFVDAATRGPRPRDARGRRGRARSRSASSGCTGSRRGPRSTNIASQRVLERNGFTRVGLDAPAPHDRQASGSTTCLWERLEDD